MVQPPLIVTFEERLTKQGVNGVVISRRGRQAYRSDGAFAETSQFHAMDGRYLHTWRQVRLLPGLEASIRDELGIFSARRSRVVPPGRDINRLDPGSECSVTFQGGRQFQKLGAETYLGYPAVKVSPVQSGKKMGHELWKIPSLACLEVRRLTTFVDAAGSPTDWSEWVATKIEQTEPPPELFAVPASFQQVLPSEELERYVARLGGKLQSHDRAAVAKEDEFAKSYPVDAGVLRSRP